MSMGSKLTRTRLQDNIVDNVANIERRLRALEVRPVVAASPLSYWPDEDGRLYWDTVETVRGELWPVLILVSVDGEED